MKGFSQVGYLKNFISSEIIIRYQFDENAIHELIEISWRDWSTEEITENLEAIVGRELSALRRTNNSE